MIGIPNKKWTERPLLVATLKPGQKASTDELLQFFQVCTHVIHLGQVCIKAGANKISGLAATLACILVLSAHVMLSMQGKIAKWWIPDDVVFVDELPHTATGKLSKLTLRQQFKGYAARKAKL